MEGQVLVIFFGILYSPHLCLSLRLSFCFLSILDSVTLRWHESKEHREDQHPPVSARCVRLSLFLPITEVFLSLSSSFVSPPHLVSLALGQSSLECQANLH